MVRRNLSPTCLVACRAPDAGTRYQCEVSGEAFRYRDAQRIGPAGPERLAFRLTTNPGEGRYRISHRISHRWLPPTEWRNSSDQQTYTGRCLREGGTPSA